MEVGSSTSHRMDSLEWEPPFVIPQGLLSCSEGRGQASGLEKEAGGTEHRVGWAMTAGHGRWESNSGWGLGGWGQFQGRETLAGIGTTHARTVWLVPKQGGDSRLGRRVRGQDQSEGVLNTSRC